jgi:Flp pilus assembly pilin Flp
MNKHSINKIRGAAMVEYALLLGGVVIVIYVALGPVATSLKAYIQLVVTKLAAFTV